MTRLPKSNERAWALSLASLALAVPNLASAQVSGSHDMADMPGMSMPSAQRKQGNPRKQAPNVGMPGENSTSGTNRGQKGEGSSEAPAGPQRDTMKDMDHGSMPGMRGGAGKQKPMQAMQGMEMGSMQGGSPPADARDPDAYAEGVQKSPMHGREMGMADDEPYGRLLVNELEYASGRGDRGQRVNAEAWYGDDYNKLWLKAEGERSGGRLGNFRTEALWDRAIAAFWSTQLGLRHDNGRGPSRDWLAFGVQGLAPYWFETEATAYVGSRGTLAARVEFRYDLLFTQRLILQPKIGANYYSRNDPDRGIGSGLSDLELGLRLRYEIRRQFAPYVGVSWSRKFGDTARFGRTAGEDVRNTRVVAGVRIWF